MCSRSRAHAVSSALRPGCTHPRSSLQLHSPPLFVPAALVVAFILRPGCPRRRFRSASRLHSPLLPFRLHSPSLPSSVPAAFTITSITRPGCTRFCAGRTRHRFRSASRPRCAADARYLTPGESASATSHWLCAQSQLESNSIQVVANKSQLQVSKYKHAIKTHTEQHTTIKIHKLLNQAIKPKFKQKYKITQFVPLYLQHTCKGISA